MSALTTDAREFYEELQEDYITQLRTTARITDAATYFNSIGAFDDIGRITDPADLRAFFDENEVCLESFFRVAPAVDQDVMIATTNPGMQSTIDRSTFTDNGEYDRQNRAGTDVEATARTVAKNLNGFLTHSDNRFDEVIDCLRTELDMLESEDDYDEYVNGEDDLLDGFFGDIHYTWVYKLATGNRAEISDLGAPGMGFARGKFIEELNVVQPTVLVCVGKEGWKAVYDYIDNEYVDPTDHIEAHSEKSPVTRSYHPELEKGAYSGLYRLPEEDLWIVTTWHASYWIKQQRLRENLQRLNRELGGT